MSIADEISTTGDVTSERDLIIYTFSGLGEEYEAFVQTVTTRETKLTFVQIQAMLSDIEVRQQKNSLTAGLSVNLTPVRRILRILI